MNRLERIEELMDEGRTEEDAEIIVEQEFWYCEDR